MTPRVVGRTGRGHVEVVVPLGQEDARGKSDIQPIIAPGVIHHERRDVLAIVRVVPYCHPDLGVGWEVGTKMEKPLRLASIPVVKPWACSYRLANWVGSKLTTVDSLSVAFHTRKDMLASAA